MKAKVSGVLMVVVILSLAFVGIAYAEDEKPHHRIRVWGEILWVDLRASAFGLLARSGEEYRFRVDRGTHFHSPDGSVKKFSDLEAGMRALVMGFQSEEGLITRLVVAFKAEPRPERIRAIGEISGIATASASFSLKKQNDDVLTVYTTERTRFRSRDGSIQSVEDLEIGMVALVIGLEGEDGNLVALTVAASHREDIPDNLRRFRGKITDVVPDQGTFTLQSLEGVSIIMQTGDRTRFVSRDGSVENLEDLRVGTLANVGALEEEDGWFVLVVAVEIPKDPPDRIWGRGRISALGDRLFTIKSGDDSEMTFFVDNSTRYRSRDCIVEGFEDLQVGMFIIVSAEKLENGKLKAMFVGVTKTSTERSDDAEYRHDQSDMPVGP